MGFGDTFGYYSYFSDDGTDYVVKLTAAVAQEGGFSVVTNPLDGSLYPYGPKNMRHCWGVAGNGKKARLPIASFSDTKFIDGGTFTLHSLQYQIQGCIGEARKLSNIGG